MPNLATILVASLIAVVVLAIVVSEIRNRKKGKCSCGCASCSMKGICHKEEKA